MIEFNYKGYLYMARRMKLSKENIEPRFGNLNNGHQSHLGISHWVRLSQELSFFKKLFPQPKNISQWVGATLVALCKVRVRANWEAKYPPHLNPHLNPLP